MTNRILQSAGLAVALLLAAPAARAQVSFSSFTVPLTGTLTGGDESVACSGPVKLSLMVVRDPGNLPNAILTIDTQGLKCTGASTGTAYLNSGHTILTRILSLVDRPETSIAVYPDAPDGHMKARTAMLALNLAYNVGSSALLKASATLSSP